MSADELLGIKPVRKGKKPDTQLQRRLQRIEKLDPKARRQITQLLDTFIEREELKWRIDSQGDTSMTRIQIELPDATAQARA